MNLPAFLLKLRGLVLCVAGTDKDERGSRIAPSELVGLRVVALAKHEDRPDAHAAEVRITDARALALVQCLCGDAPCPSWCAKDGTGQRGLNFGHENAADCERIDAERIRSVRLAVWSWLNPDDKRTGCVWWPSRIWVARAEACSSVDLSGVGYEFVLAEIEASKQRRHEADAAQGVAG